MNKVYKNAAEAITGIRNGSVIMLGGFGLCGIPENCITALVEAGVKVPIVLIAFLMPGCGGSR